MDRRTFLASVGVITGTGLSGCATFFDTGTPERPWPAGEPIDDPDGTHDLFVENHTETTGVAWLRVVRDDDAVLVDGRFELPDGRAIRFHDLAAWDRTYTIDVDVDGVGRRSFEWHTAACGDESEASGDAGSRNAAVRYEAPAPADGEPLTLWVDQCDAIDAGSLPAGSAAQFRLDA